MAAMQEVSVVHGQEDERGRRSGFFELDHPDPEMPGLTVDITTPGGGETVDDVVSRMRVCIHSPSDEEKGEYRGGYTILLRSPDDAKVDALVVIGRKNMQVGYYTRRWEDEKYLAPFPDSSPQDILTSYHISGTVNPDDRSQIIVDAYRPYGSCLRRFMHNPDLTGQSGKPMELWMNEHVGYLKREGRISVRAQKFSDRVRTAFSISSDPERRNDVSIVYPEIDVVAETPALPNLNFTIPGRSGFVDESNTYDFMVGYAPSLPQFMRK